MGANDIITTELGDYNVIFNTDSCYISIVHTQSNKVIFGNSANYIVDTGYGNADKYSQTIIKNGNIEIFPAATPETNFEGCSNYQVLSDLSQETFIQIDTNIQAGSSKNKFIEIYYEIKS